MKKLIFTISTLLFAIPGFAQTATTPVTPVEGTQMQELDQCVRIYNNEKASAKNALVKGDFTTSNADFAAANADKQQINIIKAQLKIEGVHHPLRLAHKQIKKADERLIAADIKKIKADKANKRPDMKRGDTAAIHIDENNFIADKKQLKADIHAANRDGMKHFAFIHTKS